MKSPAPSSRDKYFRQSKRQCWTGISILIAGVLCAIYAWIAAMSDMPEGAIAAGCGFAFAVFMAAVEFKESIRCRQIARRWVRWDEEAAQRSDTSHP